MNGALVRRLQEFVEHAWELQGYGHYCSWSQRLVATLRAAGEPDLANEILALGKFVDSNDWSDRRDEQAGHLDGKLLNFDNSTVNQDNSESGSSRISATNHFSSKKVFVVHGHDATAKESTARFLEKLGLDAVILHEKANSGQTVIEKFEFHSNVGFAVVLLTPDDLGAAAAAPETLKGRARQNVILELGYFTGKLGRKRVCGLFRPGVEIPSDFHGVLFIELDEPGAWRAKLAQELVSAGMQINLQGLLQM